MSTIDTNLITLADAETAGVWVACYEGLTLTAAAHLAAAGGQPWFGYVHRAVTALVMELRGITDDGTNAAGALVEQDVAAVMARVRPALEARQARPLPGWSPAAHGVRVLAATDDVD